MKFYKVNRLPQPMSGWRYGLPDYDLEKHTGTERSGLGLATVAFRLMVNRQGESLAYRREQIYEDKVVNPERRGLEAFHDGLTPEQQESFNQYIKGDITSPWLRYLLNDTDTPITDLVARDEDGRYKIPSDTYVNFMEMHNYNLAASQADALPHIENARHKFIGYVKSAVREGWIPQETATRLQEVESLSVFIDDGMRTACNNAIGVTGADNRGEKFVAIQRDFRGYEHLYMHEFVHAISDNRGKYNSLTTAGFRAGKGGTELMEGVAEHIASSLVYGDVDETHIGAPARSHLKDSYNYITGRMMLHKLCHSGLRRVDVADFIESCLSGGKVSRSLKTSLSRAFPFTDIVAEVQSMESYDDMAEFLATIDDRVNTYKRSKPFRAWFAKYRPN